MEPTEADNEIEEEHLLNFVVNSLDEELALFGRLAELAEYIDSDTVHETVDRCPRKVQ